LGLRENVICLDTHILVHALSGKLTVREQRVLSADEWSVSAIVLWELAKLVKLGRIDMDLDDADVQRALNAVRVVPITLEIARASTQLDFTGDPADELIAATSLVEGIPLLTRDKRIRRSKLLKFA
jgi:PIN domain nuclease of toxin-antitoxin system